MSFQSSCRAGKIASQKSRTSKGGGRNVSANYATKIPQRCHHPPPGSANFYSLDSKRRAPLLIEGFCLVSWWRSHRVIGLVSANGGGGGEQVKPGLAKQNIARLGALCSDWWKTSGATCPGPLRHGPINLASRFSVTHQRVHNLKIIRLQSAFLKSSPHIERLIPRSRIFDRPSCVSSQ